MVSVALPASAQSVRVNVSATGSAQTIINLPVVQGRRATTTNATSSNVERRASSTERRAVLQMNIAKRKANYTSRVLVATVERLENIIERLESRIAKVKANGGNTAESERFVAEAKTHLSAAKSSIALFVSLDLTGDRAQTNFERIRNLAQETKGHIREAHRNLMLAIRALGGSRVNVNATSSVEVNNGQ